MENIKFIDTGVTILDRDKSEYKASIDVWLRGEPPAAGCVCDHISITSSTEQDAFDLKMYLLEKLNT